MKKTCFVLSGNAYLCPYLFNFYVDNTPGEKYLVYWNRDGVEETLGSIKGIEYAKPCPDTGLLRRLYSYFAYMLFVNKQLLNSDFDHIVLLNTIAGYFAFPALLIKYRKRYVMDVRDYGGEFNPILGLMSRAIVSFAGIVVLSSRFYAAFLAPSEYSYVHNLQRPSFSDLDASSCVNSLNGNPSLPIVIAFIGSVGQYIEQHVKLINMFKNDSRFRLMFAGAGSEKLKDYCRNNHVENVQLLGRFAPEKMYSLYTGVNIIHNLYGNGDPFLDYAISNKMYIAAQLHMPILVCPNTAMETMASDYGIGFTLDLDNVNVNWPDLLFEYYTGLDSNSFIKGCEKLLTDAYDDNQNYSDRYTSFIS